MGCLTFERVVYGKKGLPLKDREFRLAQADNLSPVGTISEIKEFLEKHEIDCSHIIDKVENEQFSLFQAGHVDLATMKETKEWLLSKSKKTPKGELEIEFIEKREWER